MRVKNIIVVLAFALLMIGCANRALYNETTSVSNSLSLWTGIIFLIEIIIGLVIVGRKNAVAMSKKLAKMLGAGFVAYGVGYIILADWGFKLLNWALGCIIGKIILVILNFFGGFVSLFEGTVSIFIINTFHYHSPEISKWVIIPALIGGIGQLIILSKSKFDSES